MSYHVQTVKDLSSFPLDSRHVVHLLALRNGPCLALLSADMIVQLGRGLDRDSPRRRAPQQGMHMGCRYTLSEVECVVTRAAYSLLTVRKHASP